jgi:hypothetical protein
LVDIVERVANTVEEAIKAVPVWIGPEALGAEDTSQNDSEERMVMLRRMRVFKYSGAPKLRTIILRTSFGLNYLKQLPTEGWVQIRSAL